jgi:hypothetical protein
MHATTQEQFKHAVPPQSSIDLYRPAFPHPDRPDAPAAPSNCRINVTFRFYRPDFAADVSPRCRCGVTMILRPDMKHRVGGCPERYWWACYAGAQNEGKGCGEWREMDAVAEGRGPFAKDYPGLGAGE